MKKYKISESKLNEFWGWFGQKKPQTLQKVIDNDPILKKLDREMRDLVDSQIPILLRMKKNNPDVWEKMVEKGLVPADLK
jgi:hypothetical protein